MLCGRTDFLLWELLNFLLHRSSKMIGRTNKRHSTAQIIAAALSLALSVQLASCDINDNSTVVPPTISDISTIKSIPLSDSTDKPAKLEPKQKPAYTTGNELWDNLIRDCLKKPTFSCIQKNVYRWETLAISNDYINFWFDQQLFGYDAESRWR